MSRGRTLVVTGVLVLVVVATAASTSARPPAAKPPRVPSRSCWLRQRQSSPP